MAPSFGPVGAWRSLVAHLTGGQGVGGSNPPAPTIYLLAGTWSLRVAEGPQAKRSPDGSRVSVAADVISPVAAHSIPMTSLGRARERSGMKVTINTMGRWPRHSSFMVGTTYLSSESLLMPAAM